MVPKGTPGSHRGGRGGRGTRSTRGGPGRHPQGSIDTSPSVADGHGNIGPNIDPNLLSGSALAGPSGTQGVGTGGGGSPIVSLLKKSFQGSSNSYHTTV